MEANQQFKSNIKEKIIESSRIYKKIFIDYDYLLCSKAFVKNEFYTIKAFEDNFQHLTGVKSRVAALDFFNLSYSGKLKEEDFFFKSKSKTDKSIRSTIRDKVTVLPDIHNIFSKDSLVQEDFKRNSIMCLFAIEKEKITLGFTCEKLSKPKTLLKGKKLDQEKARHLDLVLRRKRGEDKFGEMIVGDEEILKKYVNTIKEQLSEELLQSVKAYEEKDMGDDCESE